MSRIIYHSNYPIFQPVEPTAIALFQSMTEDALLIQTVLVTEHDQHDMFWTGSRPPVILFTTEDENPL